MRDMTCLRNVMITPKLQTADQGDIVHFGGTFVVEFGDEEEDDSKEFYFCGNDSETAPGFLVADHMWVWHGCAVKAEDQYHLHAIFDQLVWEGKPFMLHLDGTFIVGAEPC